MKTFTTIAMSIAIATLSACSASPPSQPGQPVLATPTPQASADASAATSDRVSGMAGSYEAQAELTMDPCQDRFIESVESLGYQLNERLEPNTSTLQGYPHSQCGYTTTNASVLISATSGQYLASLDGELNVDSIQRYSTTINDRFAVVSPYAQEHGGCWIGVKTTFGQMTFLGRPPRLGFPGHMDACEFTKDFLTNLEPSFYD